MNYKQEIDNIVASSASATEKGHSQFEEDAIIEFVFSQIPHEQYFVDIGAGAYSGGMSNTQLLRERGWKGVGFDMTEGEGIIKAFVTPDNIVDLLKENGVPEKFGFLNLDIDSCDYWVLEQVLEHFTPTLICTEFNGCLDPNIPKVLRYTEGYTWDGTDKYGYSFKAGEELLDFHGYTIIYNLHDTNIFAIHNSFIDAPDTVTAKRNQYHPHNPANHWIIL